MLKFIPGDDMKTIRKKIINKSPFSSKTVSSDDKIKSPYRMKVSVDGGGSYSYFNAYTRAPSSVAKKLAYFSDQDGEPRYLEGYSKIVNVNNTYRRGANIPSDIIQTVYMTQPQVDVDGYYTTKFKKVNEEDWKFGAWETVRGTSSLHARYNASDPDHYAENQQVGDITEKDGIQFRHIIYEIYRERTAQPTITTVEEAKSLAQIDGIRLFGDDYNVGEEESIVRESGYHYSTSYGDRNRLNGRVFRSHDNTYVHDNTPAPPPPTPYDYYYKIQQRRIVEKKVFYSGEAILLK